MDIDTDASAKLVSEKPSGSGLQVTLHPLALLNMSDHYTRNQIQFPNDPRPVIGALFGTQRGREICIHTTYELLCTINESNQLRLESEYYLAKQEKIKQVFPDYDILGWYTVTHSNPTTQDMDLHEQLRLYNENLLHLRLKPTYTPSANGALPATVYDTETELGSDNRVVTRFAMLSYTLETGEAERIAVDHVAKIGGVGETGSGEQESSLVSQLTNHRGAVSMLRERVRLLRAYVRDVHEGVLPPDPELLREVTAICHRLPVMEEDKEWVRQFSRESHDAVLVAHLSTMTKAVYHLSELVAKFNQVRNAEYFPMDPGAGGRRGPRSRMGRMGGKRAKMTVPGHPQHGVRMGMPPMSSHRG